MIDDYNDAMPREVATAMLTAPKAKISNTMRKNCRAARCSYMASTATIVRKDDGSYDYLPQVPRSTEQKVADRLRHNPPAIAQLSKWTDRLFKRERHFQSRADKTEILSRQMHFTLKAAECRTIAEAILEEIHKRHSHVIAYRAAIARRAEEKKCRAN